MKFLFTTFAVTLSLLAALSGAAHSQSLQELASGSSFVKIHYDTLKSRNARSVYASKNPICPSVYWMSFTTSHASAAKQKWSSDVAREMKTAGFPQNTIAKCQASGGFIYEELKLNRHPKNSKYEGFVKAGVLVWEKQGDYGPTAAPVFVQTNDYTGSQTFRVHDHNFKEICKVRAQQWNFKGTCRPFGAVGGRAVKDGDRLVLRWQNASVRVAVFTNRTVSYAMKNF